MVYCPPSPPTTNLPSPRMSPESGRCRVMRLANCLKRTRRSCCRAVVRRSVQNEPDVWMRDGAEEAEDVAVLSQSASAHKQTGGPQNNTMEDWLCRLYMQTKKSHPQFYIPAPPVTDGCICKRLWSMMPITVLIIATLSSPATRCNDYRLLAY